MEMRLCILISTIALLNRGFAASALAHRGVAPYLKPAADFAPEKTPGVPRTGVPVQDLRRRNLWQTRNANHPL
ncbi:hypothetical protein BDN71DRAFT_1438352 [Pleurotus eryngii]|uniref:Uncharacterized protein n=1 Tax=Pleurotus eryngii TaxID=5323 RepID=A0A9P6A9F8_PLEER|nr:hypothetical protein BDN71DRAFT_1438352 [Pleurotus eryngii]